VSFIFANDLKSSIVWVTGTSFTFVNDFRFWDGINAGSLYKNKTLVAEFGLLFLIFLTSAMEYID
jgi:hypothetical protein